MYSHEKQYRCKSSTKDTIQKSCEKTVFKLYRNCETNDNFILTEQTKQQFRRQKAVCLDHQKEE